MHSIILVMSLMGSTILAVYYLFRHLLQKNFPLDIQIEFLKLSIMFFVFPFPHFKYWIYDVWNFFTHIDFLTPKGDYLIVEQSIKIINHEKIIFHNINVLIFVGAGIYFVVMVLWVQYKIKNYLKLKAYILEDAQVCDDKKLLGFMKKEKEARKLKNDIRLVVSDKVPLSTMGIFKPIIVLPKDYKMQKNIIYAVKHEVSHIYTKDFVIKILLAVTRILHWFNPLVYVLSNEMNKLLEFRADRNVTSELSDEEIKVYGEYIIDSAIEDERFDGLLTVSFSGSKKIIKERIIEMKRKKIFSSKKMVLGSVFICALSLVNTALVFAYKDYPVENYSEYTYGGGETISVINLNDDFDYFDIGEDDDFSKGDVIIKDEDGNIIDAKESSEDEKRSCSHTYINSTKTEHTLDGNGGCTVKKYNIRYCTKCGNTTNVTLISTASYNPCPH